MTPRVATVLSAREWEAALVALARETAAVRLVLRAYQPSDIERQREEIDLVVAGAETSWLTPAVLAGWRRIGLSVVGIYPAGDRPARDLLEAGEVDEVISDDHPPSDILQTIRFLHPGRGRPRGKASGRLVAVTGGRGAPGRTEVALALSWNMAASRSVLLIDADLEGPSLAIRAGCPPRPDITDAADAVRNDGWLAPAAIHRFGNVRLIVGSHRPGEPLLRESLVEDVVEASLGSVDVVVVDLGPHPAGRGIVKRADQAVVVVDSTATGLVRAARLVDDWAGPPPVLVLNRVPKGGSQDVVEAARRWTGLEPAALLRDHPRVRDAARRAAPPERALRRSLTRLAGPW